MIPKYSILLLILSHYQLCDCMLSIQSSLDSSDYILDHLNVDCRNLGKLRPHVFTSPYFLSCLVTSKFRDVHQVGSTNEVQHRFNMTTRDNSFGVSQEWNISRRHADGFCMKEYIHEESLLNGDIFIIKVNCSPIHVFHIYSNSYERLLIRKEASLNKKTEEYSGYKQAYEQRIVSYVFMAMFLYFLIVPIIILICYICYKHILKSYIEQLFQYLSTESDNSSNLPTRPYSPSEDRIFHPTVVRSKKNVESLQEQDYVDLQPMSQFSPRVFKRFSQIMKDISDTQIDKSTSTCECSIPCSYKDKCSEPDEDYVEFQKD